MKYLVSWTPRPGGSGADNEAAIKRSLEVFSKWSPPESDTFHAFLARVDGNGGYALIESDNPLGALDSASKFAPWFEFQVVPVVDMGEAVPVFNESIAWRESIG